MSKNPETTLTTFTFASNVCKLYHKAFIKRRQLRVTAIRKIPKLSVFQPFTPADITFIVYQISNELSLPHPEIPFPRNLFIGIKTGTHCRYIIACRYCPLEQSILAASHWQENSLRVQTKRCSIKSASQYQHFPLPIENKTKTAPVCRCGSS